jgi:hypothetical protein
MTLDFETQSGETHSPTETTQTQREGVFPKGSEKPEQQREARLPISETRQSMLTARVYVENNDLSGSESDRRPLGLNWIPINFTHFFQTSSKIGEWR